jgi:hypothetical protein
MRTLAPYEEQTIGWIILFLLLPVQGIIFWLYVEQIGDRPIDAIGIAVFQVVTLLVVALFYRMKTIVDHGRLTVSFGIGLIRRSIDLNDVREAKFATNPWHYGWGIRHIPNGRLYNLSGSEAVELSFRSTGRVIRIGSPSARQLLAEIEARTPRRGQV